MTTISQFAFCELRKYITKECGIAIADNKQYLIENRLQDVMLENGCLTIDDLLDEIRRENTGALRDQIIDAITTNETLWFRDQKPYNLLNENLLPMLCQRLVERKVARVRIWSAASSTGQEPYSIAMQIHRHLANNHYPGVRANHFEIMATDICQSALTIAKSGRYDPMSMSRGLPLEYKSTYFDQDGRASVIKKDIRDSVRFRQLNLMQDFTHLGKFDIVFCRNVLIYFNSETKGDIFSRMAKVIRDDGCLILGSAETVRGYTEQFKSVQWNGYYYYKTT